MILFIGKEIKSRISFRRSYLYHFLNKTSITCLVIQIKFIVLFKCRIEDVLKLSNIVLDNTNKNSYQI